MSATTFHGGTVILADTAIENGRVRVEAGRIQSVEAHAGPAVGDIDLAGGYLVPGFVDLHIHGGDGHDFLDGTETAFRAICKAHARHGTTSLLPTTTVARHEQHLAFLGLCRRLKKEGTGGARIIGAHFYGPYFAYEARGAHPGAAVRAPVPEEYNQYLAFADSISTATVAPELPGAEAFVRACRAHGIRCNSGHSHATFDQMEAAV